MPTKEELRNRVRENLDEVVAKVNATLLGKNLDLVEPVLARLGRGSTLPHWYEKLKTKSVLPNLDGKTVGSVVEMLLVAVLETDVLVDLGVQKLNINPAKGVDLPDLDLGVKSPSENYCTSEPFFSAYERLYGSTHDVIAFITDYQTAKDNPPLKLQIIGAKYLTKSQIADRRLCKIAKKQRKWLVEKHETRAKKFFRFLCYINQQDWIAVRILRLFDNLQSDKKMFSIIEKAGKEFETTNKVRIREDKPLIPDESLHFLQSIAEVKPMFVSVIDAADNWVIETHKDMARTPNDNEWGRLLESPLEGMIGLSLALQWRYNFGQLFRDELSSSST